MESLLLSEDQVYDHPKNLNVHKSMEPNEMYPRILREMVDVVASHCSCY